MVRYLFYTIGDLTYQSPLVYIEEHSRYAYVAIGHLEYNLYVYCLKQKIQRIRCFGKWTCLLPKQSEGNNLTAVGR